MGDIAKELAVRWRAMTAGDKIPFDKGAAKDKERYIKVCIVDGYMDRWMLTIFSLRMVLLRSRRDTSRHDR